MSDSSMERGPWTGFIGHAAFALGLCSMTEAVKYAALGRISTMAVARESNNC